MTQDTFLTSISHIFSNSREMCQKMIRIYSLSRYKSHLYLDEVKRNLTFRKLYLDLSFEYLPVLLDCLSYKDLKLSTFTIIHVYKL